MKKVSLLISLFTCFLLTGCTNKTEEVREVKKEDTNVIKTVTQDNLTFRNVSIEITDEGSKIITEIENNGSRTIPVNSVLLSLKDENDNVIKTLSSYVGDEIKPKESVAVVTKVAAKINIIKSIDYVVQ